ncbi:hypothetical protein WDW86_13330, partial [Bdellovibrionota bacterium FG-2]
MAKLEAVHSKKVDGRICPHFSPSFMFKRTLGMLYFQARSVNAFTENDIVYGHVDPPGQRTWAYYVEHSSVAALNRALWDQVHTAMRLKQLDD